MSARGTDGATASESVVGRQISEALEALVEPLTQTESVSLGLCKRIEREGRAMMEGLARRGAITRFVLRCDLETSQAAGEPVIEVWFREPKRVREVVVRVGAVRY